MRLDNRAPQAPDYEAQDSRLKHELAPAQQSALGWRLFRIFRTFSFRHSATLLDSAFQQAGRIVNVSSDANNTSSSGITLGDSYESLGVPRLIAWNHRRGEHCFLPRDDWISAAAVLGCHFGHHV